MKLTREEMRSEVVAFSYDATLKKLSEKVKVLAQKLAATQLKVAELATENAALKKSEPAPFSKLMMDALDAYQSGADVVPELAMLSAYTKLRDGIKTPSTESAIAEIGARALDAHADDLRSKIGNPAFNDAAHSYAARRANEFAKKLRAEASK